MSPRNSRALGQPPIWGGWRTSESGSGTCICQGTEVASRLTYLLNNLNLRHCTPVFTHAPEESVNRIFLHSLFPGRCVGLLAAEAQTESKTSNPARGCRNNATRASAVLKLKQNSSYTAESGSGPVILLSLLSILCFFLLYHCVSSLIFSILVYTMLYQK